MDALPPTISYSAAGSRRLVGAYVFSVLMILGAAVEGVDGLLTAGSFGTVYERPTDRPLFLCEVGGASLVLFAALALLLHRKLSWGVVLILQLLAAAGQSIPIRATRAAIAEATTRGGDTGPLSALGHLISLVMEGGLIVLCLAAAGYLCLPAVRRAFAAKGI